MGSSPQGGDGAGGGESVAGARTQQTGTAAEMHSAHLLGRGVLWKASQNLKYLRQPSTQSNMGEQGRNRFLEQAPSL